MKNKHIFIPLFVFLGAGVVSLVASIIDFTVTNKQSSYSTETIQFNFDGASDGYDPNGNPFNASSFLSDEIITNALNESGLDYKVSAVRKYIAVENIVPKNIVKEIESYTSFTGEIDKASITSKDYHPVRYCFSINNDLDTKLSSKKLNEFLGNIVDEYCTTFYNTYKKTFDQETYANIYAIDTYDYIYQTQVFTNRIQILDKDIKGIF